MNFSILQNVIAPVFLATVLVACASAPTQEMSDARQSVKAAREVEADKYTPDAFSSAEKMLSNAEKELLAHSYRHARMHALSSRREAIKARNMARAIGEAKAVISEADQLDTLSNLTSARLAQAEAASREGEESLTVELAHEARKLAEDDVIRGRVAKVAADQEQERLSINQANLDKTKLLLREIKKHKKRMNPEQRAVLAEIEQAYSEGAGFKAFDLASRLQKEIKAATKNRQK